MVNPDGDRRRQLRAEFKAAERDRVRQSLPIDEDDLIALVEYVDGLRADQGCDHTARFAARWAEETGVEWVPLRDALAEHGGFCDCEIVANCHPEELFR